MKTPSLNFGGTIPQNYEDLLGPFIFEPFAVDLISRLDLSQAQHLLELACGSGRLTKHIADNLPASANFVASDLNSDMIAVAKTKVPSLNITWATVDMLDIPYADDHFDLIVCQFGIMLVPDQMKALAEIFRVLKPGGKLVFSTWGPITDNPLWLTANAVLSSFLAQHPLLSNPGPFAMSDENAVLNQLETTGFKVTKASSSENTGEIASTNSAANGFIQGLPVLSFIMAQAPNLLPEIIIALTDALVKQLGDNPMLAPQRAWVLEAVK